MLFRSKSCGVNRTGTAKSTMISSPHASSDLYLSPEEDEMEDEREEEEEEDDDECFAENRVRTPFMVTEAQMDHNQHNRQQNQGNQFQILDIVMAVLRKSLITCSVVTDEVSSTDIGWPTEVRHVSHVTFDRFNGFLGLPVELQPDVPRKVPSASASVFGVSAKSMQCSYDECRNSVPTILLMMQKRLYDDGGLQAEGIFRINGENSKEEYVRHQLNKGIVPPDVDVHSLAGLIKAWFRELPNGVLDSLNPENVMQCNTEENCTQLIRLLPPTEAALLDWGINLMADVVRHEHLNKMNARNIAMVFAPNMTQMADPLTALLHAVQVMNLLKTLIMVKLRENQNSLDQNQEQDQEGGANREYDERILEKVKVKKGVRRLYKHPVFQLSKTVKKTSS